MSDIKLYSLNKSVVTLVKTQSSDFEALVAIRIEAMFESLKRLGRFDRIRVRERFREGFNPDFTRYIEVSGERVGFRGC